MLGEIGHKSVIVFVCVLFFVWAFFTLDKNQITTTTCVCVCVCYTLDLCVAAVFPPGNSNIHSFRSSEMRKTKKNANKLDVLKT